MSKVWLVTGSSVGLGRTIVEVALAAGHRVIATARDAQTLTQLESRYPESLLTIALDVRHRQAWDSVIETGIRRFGGIDVLVNNAGFGALGSVENTPIDVVQQLIDTNLIGAVHACQAIIPLMRNQRQGQIILISSIGARISTPGAAFYYASKAAVSALAESLAPEIAPLGIRVTAIEPGGMRTRFAEAASLKVIPSDPEYAGTVGATVGMMQSPDYKAYLSDPIGHAALVMKVAELPDPPVRLLAGADAVTFAAHATQRRTEIDDEWKELSQSATVQ